MKLENVEDVYPLSPMQNLMLLHSVSTPHEGTLLNQLCYEIQGKFSSAIFEKAWQEILNRHAALRTAFIWENVKKPLQVVREHVRLPWEILDWRDVDRGLQDQRFDSLCEADEKQGFDLRHAPLMRFTLVRLADDLCHLIWSSHHLVIDRWCLTIVLNELLVVYRALNLSKRPVLAPARPFRDYIAWLQNQDPSAAEKHWRNRLRKIFKPTYITLANHKDHGFEGRSRYAEIELDISPRTTSKLKDFARQYQLTMSVVLQGGWAAILGQCGGTDDVIFGMTVSGRPSDLPAVESIVGSFINNVPVRIKIVRERSLLSWLKDLQKSFIELQPFQHPSLADIQSWSEIPMGQALFDTLLLFLAPEGLQQEHIDDFEMKGIRGTLRTNYPLTIAVVECNNTLKLKTIYDTNRMDSQFCKAALRNLELLLESIVGEPEQNVDSLASCVHFDVNLLSKNSLAIDSVSNSNDDIAVQENAEKPKSYIIASNAQRISRIQNDSVEHVLVKIWQQVLGVDSVGVDDNFFYIGGNSVSAIQLFTKIEQSTGKRLPIATLYSAPTVRQISTILKDEGWSPNWSSLVLMKSGDFTRPLFAVPAAASTVLEFEALVRYLDVPQAIYGLQPIGFDGEKNRPHRRVEDMAAHYISEIVTVQPNGPYFLLGRCFGSKVVFEMAHQLSRQGKKVAFLAVLDSEPPQHIESEGAPEKPGKSANSYLQKSLKHLHNGRLTRVLKNKLITSTTALLSRKHRHIQRVVEAHSVANRAYVGKVYKGKITLIRSEKSHNSPSFNWHRERWSKLAISTDYYVVPGDHITMVHEANIEKLATVLAQCIDKANRETRGLTAQTVG